MFLTHLMPASHGFLRFSYTDSLSNLQVYPDFFYFSPFYILHLLLPMQEMLSPLFFAWLVSSHPSGHNLNVTSSERPFLISVSRYSSFWYTVLFLDYFLYDIDHFLPTYYLFTPLSPPPTLHYSMINLMSTCFATFLQQPAECLTQNTNSDL